MVIVEGPDGFWAPLREARPAPQVSIHCDGSVRWAGTTFKLDAETDKTALCLLRLLDVASVLRR
jgi:hypothetical protein